MAEGAKLVVLTKMRDLKAKLFGDFSPNFTKTDKDCAWQEIAEEAKALGVVKPNISVDYFRQVTWQNWRRRTLEKRDKKRKTGEGKCSQFTGAEQIILDIIGRDSAALSGLKVPEASGTAAAALAVPEIVLPTSISECEIENEEPTQSTTNIPVSASRQQRQLNKKNRPISEVENLQSREKKLRLEKLSLQNEALKLDIFKKKLETYEKEQSLGLDFSKTTLEFLKERND